MRVMSKISIELFDLNDRTQSTRNSSYLHLHPSQPSVWSTEVFAGRKSVSPPAQHPQSAFSSHQYASPVRHNRHLACR